MERHLAGQPIALGFAATDEDGAALAITAPATVSVADGAGTVVDSGSATVTAGALSYSVAAGKCALLDTYTVTWTGTAGGAARSWQTEFEVVGGYLFEVADLRAYDRAFADPVKYPSATLREVRSWVEDAIERAANVAFVPRGRRVRVSGSAPDLFRGYHPLLYGTDYRGLLAPDLELRELYACSINGTDMTADDLAGVTVDDAMLWRSAGVQWPAWSFGRANISLHYSHGRDAAPGPIKRAALILAREYLVASGIPGRATATSIGDQMFRLTIAGRDGATGLPEVDAAIAQFGRQRFGIV